MTAALELRDLIRADALRQATLSGTIGEVSISEASVIVESRPIGLLRGFGGTPTVVQVLPTAADVRIIILGGRPGIPVNQELATVAIGGRPLPEVASQVVSIVADYLAASTS